MSIPTLKYTIKTSLINNKKEYDLDSGLRLIDQLDKLENLQAAAKHCNYSYRKAWNILQDLESLFRQPLVLKQRGKGTQLSELGRLLLANKKDIDVLFRDSLMSAERKANLILKNLYNDIQALIIIASDSEKLELLRQLNLNIELHIDGSGQALLAYAEGKCNIAGFHIGLGGHNKKQIDAYLQYLDSKHDQFIALEHRQQGLISHPDRPVTSLQQMIEQDLTFVNRQQDSGTRNLLNQLLQEQNIQAEQLNGYYHEEHTHLAVASMVSSRQADAGLGIRSAAERLKLQFTPISNELYFLVFKSLTPTVQQVLGKLSDQGKLEVINYKQFTQLILVRS